MNITNFDFPSGWRGESDAHGNYHIHLCQKTLKNFWLK